MRRTSPAFHFVLGIALVLSALPPHYACWAGLPIAQSNEPFDWVRQSAATTDIKLDPKDQNTNGLIDRDEYNADARSVRTQIAQTWLQLDPANQADLVAIRGLVQRYEPHFFVTDPQDVPVSVSTLLQLATGVRQPKEFRRQCGMGEFPLLDQHQEFREVPVSADRTRTARVRQECSPANLPLSPVWHHRLWSNRFGEWDMNVGYARVTDLNRVYEGRQLFSVQYFLLFPNNRVVVEHPLIGRASAGDHEGDWTGVDYIVAVDRDSTTQTMKVADARFVGLVVHNHGRQFFHEPAFWEQTSQAQGFGIEIGLEDGTHECVVGRDDGPPDWEKNEHVRINGQPDELDLALSLGFAGERHIIGPHSGSHQLALHWQLVPSPGKELRIPNRGSWMDNEATRGTDGDLLWAYAGQWGGSHSSPRSPMFQPKMGIRQYGTDLSPFSLGPTDREVVAKFAYLTGWTLAFGAIAGGWVGLAIASVVILVVYLIALDLSGGWGGGDGNDGKGDGGDDGNGSGEENAMGGDGQDRGDGGSSAGVACTPIELPALLQSGVKLSMCGSDLGLGLGSEWKRLCAIPTKGAIWGAEMRGNAQIPKRVLADIGPIVAGNGFMSDGSAAVLLIATGTDASKPSAWTFWRIRLQKDGAAAATRTGLPRLEGDPTADPFAFRAEVGPKLELLVGSPLNWDPKDAEAFGKSVGGTLTLAGRQADITAASVNGDSAGLELRGDRPNFFFFSGLRPAQQSIPQQSADSCPILLKELYP